MPKALMFAVCDHAFMDHKGKPCLIGLTHQLFANKFPHYRSVLTCALLIRVAPNEPLNLSFEFGRSGEEPLMTMRIEPHGTASGIVFFPVQLGQVQFPKPGVYSVIAKNGDDAIATTLLAVAQGDD